MKLLEGVRVVEVGGGIAASYATKLFADFGADVIKVEPPEGDETRRMAPFVGDVPDAERSAIFLHTNTGKRSVVLELSKKKDRETCARLAASADIVVESFKPGILASMGLGFEDLIKLQPQLVLTSITAFGQDGPYAQYEGSELIYYGMGGPMLGNGEEDREPVKLGGYMSVYQTGNTAATATIGALMVAEEQNEPTHIDISGFETGLSSSDRRTSFLLNYSYNGEVTGRGNLLGGIMPNGAFPTSDGYVQIILTQAWLPRMLRTLQDPDLDAYFAQVAENPALFATMATKEAIDAALYPWLLDRTKNEVMQQAQANKWPVTAINTPVEVLTDQHFVAREFFTSVEYPGVGAVTQPGAPFRIAEGWELAAAPALGADTTEVLSSLPAMKH
ncbi:CoA transferase [soil metagenome]